MASVAQLAARKSHNLKVVSSILTRGIFFSSFFFVTIDRRGKRIESCEAAARLFFSIAPIARVIDARQSQSFSLRVPGNCRRITYHLKKLIFFRNMANTLHLHNARTMYGYYKIIICSFHRKQLDQ
jgi:hypothetical protein